MNLNQKRKHLLCTNLLVIAICFLGINLFFPQVLAEKKIANWSYDGADNPTQWSKISPDFQLCEIGKYQSPININNPTDTTSVNPANIEFNYKPTSLSVVNNGHTIQVNYQPSSTIKIQGKKYELLQFHFHTPSEHTISGKASAMELHLVHRNPKGEIAVLGVMMEKGKSNPWIEQIWRRIPTPGTQNDFQNLTINAANFLPKSKSYFSYTGSFTTPPCTENVSWNLLIKPIQISERQITTFQTLYQVNARPVQPVNGRIIEFHQ